MAATAARCARLGFLHRGLDGFGARPSTHRFILGYGLQVLGLRRLVLRPRCVDLALGHRPLLRQLLIGLQRPLSLVPRAGRGRDRGRGLAQLLDPCSGLDLLQVRARDALRGLRLGGLLARGLDRRRRPGRFAPRRIRPRHGLVRRGLQFGTVQRRQGLTRAHGVTLTHAHVRQPPRQLEGELGGARLEDARHRQRDLERAAGDPHRVHLGPAPAGEHAPQDDERHDDGESNDGDDPARHGRSYDTRSGGRYNRWTVQGMTCRVV